MKITDKEKETVGFSRLNDGDCFRAVEGGTSILMKIETVYFAPTSNPICNAVFLSNGTWTYIEPSRMVFPVDAEIVVK